MNKNHFSFFILSLSLLLSSPTVAQDEAAAESGLRFAPIEIFVCNFNKGQGQADLDKVIANWNAYMDKSGSPPYSAWTYTAYYNSPDYQFDLAWMGVWPDGKSMGKGTDQWLSTGGVHSAAFDKVLTCGAHSNFASTQFRGSISENSDTAVIEFSDCTFKEGGNFPDAMKAAGTWNAYMTEQGSVGSEWFFFPVYGGDPDWHFKRVNAYPNYAELGADYDRYGNGGGYIKRFEMLNDAYDCGVSRIYNAKRVRAGLPQE